MSKIRHTKTYRIALLGVLTALYVVLSAFLKVPIGVGHLMLDLGYMAFAVALCEFGMLGAVVGVIGCSIESILFDAWGFSISWAVANLIIGLGCGFVFNKTDKLWARIASIILFCAIAFVGAKTAIECTLYDIPVLVKLPKSAVAFALDAAVMIIGLLIYTPIKKRLNRKGDNE